MQCLVGIDDTDSSRGWCTTYLAYRIAADLRPVVEVLPYPRLVRLNPNVPFKTRGNAAVCLPIETRDPGEAFELVSEKVRSLSDIKGGANSGMVFLEDTGLAAEFVPLYDRALCGMVSPHRVRRMLKEQGVRSMELGNGMGVVGAASSLGFDGLSDRTYELISYRKRENWGTRRLLDSESVVRMDRSTFPRTYNNYDYQKRKVLVAPHGPDPVFAGVRGDSPQTVLSAFKMLSFDEELQGHMVYVTNQHTDAHLKRPLDWKAFSSGWADGTVERVKVGAGGHTYVELEAGGMVRRVAAYEPTGDLRRVARLLQKGDRVRAFGGVRRGTKKNLKILNLEKLEVKSTTSSPVVPGTYISSPRANRHLTKPLVRYGIEAPKPSLIAEDWLSAPRRQQVLAGSP